MTKLNAEYKTPLRNGNGTIRLFSLLPAIGIQDFKKAYDLVRKELLYNILVNFGVPINQVRLIKMSLN
jgi:hypothetical protein